MSSGMLILSAVVRREERRSRFRPSFRGVSCVVAVVGRRRLRSLLELRVLGFRFQQWVVKEEVRSDVFGVKIFALVAGMFQVLLIEELIVHTGICLGGK
jgi:hypothetical protein